MRRLTFLVMLLVMSPALLATEHLSTRFLLAQPNASAPAPLMPRLPFRKPSHDDLVRGQHEDSAIIKFTEGTAIRLRDKNLVVLDSDLEIHRAERQGVTRSILDIQLARLNAILLDTRARIDRLLSTAEDALRAQRRRGEANTNKELADLNLFFELRFPGKAVAYVVEALNLLNQFDIVEYAAPKAKLAPPPTDLDPPTPSFTANQTYFAPAPGGIDVGYARLLPGGRGEGLRVVDVEQGWYLDHEDFPPLVGSSGNNYVLARHHGTAVIGEIAAVENTYGMTGIAPAVEISMSSPVVPPNDSYNVPDGVQRAVDQSRSGDIILIEQQVWYNWPDDLALCPPEWGLFDSAVFDIVANAVADGRIVVETAGNGAQNLDDSARFNTRFNRNVQDSGAIYAGSGNPSTHIPRVDSNFGSRLDVQGWGDNIATLGTGLSGADLFFPNGDVRQAYTSTFAGTSGAAPIVTGAAALIQGVRRGRGLPDLTSQQMRSALLVGATPQGAGVNVGPLPDLRDAIAAIPVPIPTNMQATGAGNGSATLTWSTVPGVSGYEIHRKDAHGDAWTVLGGVLAPPFTDPGLAVGKAYLYRVRAYDAAGNRSPDSNFELATTIDYTDPQLTTTTSIRAKHMIEGRTAGNAICTYAGTGICASLPFTGSSLDENQVKTEQITASDFVAVKNQITALRSAIGASAATFGETPSVGMTVRVVHMEDLRRGAN